VARERIFKQGGVLSITSRILIVDMLNAKIELANITGIVVLHAEEYVQSLHRLFFLVVTVEHLSRGASPSHPPSL
jgi:DNA excision repair protein ERCC-4